MPRLWDDYRVTAMLAVALVPVLGVVIFERGLSALAALGLALALGVGWPMVFARLRRGAMRWDGMISAGVLVVMLPGAVPLWQMALALSFGLVFGDLIFGARGRSFLNAAAVGLAFWLFSFPGVVEVDIGLTGSIAAAAGGAVLLGVGLVAWRVIVGFVGGVVAAALVLGVWGDWALMPGATLLVGLVFLIGDPVAASCTNAGRWIYGVLAGVLVVVLGLAGGPGLAPLVFGALLASIFAPLIDQGVIMANLRRRARRRRDV
jgi:Na+-transporting NADH:ubiquinone oxidoreductase subunit B